jgi:predicted RNA binding protein YcfA (HicA-like mRNA interferase family)
LYSSKQISKALITLGFTFISQNGLHGKFSFNNGTTTVIVPMGKRELPVGTFKSILKQASVSANDIERALE